ncbi:hypothetical protein BO94DRAFT_529079 [Aspergillus sclerotioniger CBS 115572]|uniref:Zn(2)-C6 fungal-type domain-containing protein n=1 Tax=Aspergillus sclerotioniger CBS 115572 TaxID=1450535 RepID=A0A317V0H7_9EURO|nr:hypothetical protein BO94DRAFT_529079 [Aspergillus sclerotioniger CBS 115572]PWY65680.1 hypothetical protein BO94DRAFT_529079 [Aspergillus sclerotioniger CBS 115572]
MARHGRLSKGCQVCRKRKIKCDQARPHCSQCLKAGWKCPQYNDSIDRMFLHHTPIDLNRYSSQTYTGSMKEIELSRNTDNVRYTPASTLPPTIIQRIECRAIDFFMSTHAFQEQGLIRGHYEYLSAFKSDVMTDKRVLASLNAVALAAYAYKFQHLGLLQKARRYYVSSLRYINSALSCRREAAEDGSLISILFLNTFEALTCETQDSLYHREAHLRGITTIVELRGVSLFQSRRGLQLFRQVFLCLSVSCLMHSVRMPAGLIKLHRYATVYMDADDPAWELSDIMLTLASFRADIKDHALCDPSSIIESANKIDRDLCSLAEHMPSQCHFQTMDTEGISDLVLETQYHIYPDVWVAAIWNNIRTCRLLLHQEIKAQLEVVLDTSPHTFSLSDAFQHQHSTTTIQQLILDICASVPQYCGHLPLLAGSSSPTQHATLSEDTINHNSPGGIPTTAGIYLLFWPLLNAGQLTDSDTQRNWIVSRSRYIGKMTGIQQAFVLGDIVETGMDPFH